MTINLNDIFKHSYPKTFWHAIMFIFFLYENDSIKIANLLVR